MKTRPTIIPTPRFWSVHTHSRYSVNDAMPTVEEIVVKAKELGQKAVGLTDHGNMAGSVDLYQACMSEGLVPFPGSELYFVPDTAQYKLDYKNRHKKAERFHMGVVAYTGEGYENLVRLSTLSHQNHFHKPTVDYVMLAQLAEDGRTQGLAITTGCYFGYAVQSLITQGEDACKQFLTTLSSWFTESVYVEIQNHNIDHGDGWNDDKVADAMVSIADQLGLPVVITQDSHYVEPGDRADHEALKRLVAFGPDPDDAVFPGDGFHLADDQWMREHHHPDRFARGVEGLADLLSRHTLRIPVLDAYTYSVPRVVHNPQEVMEQRCVDALAEKGLLKGRYTAQLEEEFDVIRSSEMAGYMMLVAQLTDYMKEKGIVYQTRGSAAGSLVSWLLGISNVDPIKWDLRFERFLSRDRTKPPDIDLDIAHDRRDEVIEWLNTRFVAHQIGSWALYSLEGEQDETGETQKGSLRVRYFSAAGKKENGASKWEEVPEVDKEMLYRLSARHLYKGMGTNAAGVVLTSTTTEFEKLVPLAYMTRGGFVTQYSKDQIEALGLVKLDVLGSKTLTVIRKAMDNLGLPIERLEDIEFKDGPSFAMMKKGDTEGVFQLEGRSSKWGCRDLKPNHIKDVIAAMALFRPATMNSGETKHYINRKHGREQIPQRHELLMKISQPTYGVMLYQEQVIDLLRALGMDAENLTKFLKAVKASNKAIGDAGKVIESYMAWINDKCTEMGMTDEDRHYLDQAIAGFAEYGFNRAHATVYGITAYRCAYLAARHPLEFHAALLAVAAGGGKDSKEERYLQATRRRGIRILPAVINLSGVSYTVDAGKHAVRKGLVSIRGIGGKSAQVLAEHSPYRDLDDLIDRVNGVSGWREYDGTAASLTGILANLRESGAIDQLRERM